MLTNVTQMLTNPIFQNPKLIQTLSFSGSTLVAERSRSKRGDVRRTEGYFLVSNSKIQINTLKSVTLSGSASYRNEVL